MTQPYAQKYINALPYAYACCKNVYNEHGDIVDTTFININPAFESIFSVADHAMADKSIRGFLADFDLQPIGLFGPLGDGHCAETRTVYCKSMRRWFKLEIFLLEYGVFAMQLQDITAESQILSSLLRRKNAQNSNIDLDFLFNGAQDCMFMAEYIDGNFYYIY